MKTGINIVRCNVGTAEMHNSRDTKYIAAVNASPKKKYSIFEDQTIYNSTWINPSYSDVSLPELLDKLRNIYKAQVGQAPQEQDRVREITDKKTGLKKTITTAGWSPIREGVCPIKATTQISDFVPFVRWLSSKGLQVIRLDLHHDEGHVDELSGERKYNHHAHIVIDWIDHETGKSRKLSKVDTAEMQTQLAASLRMERGVSKELTGVDHLSPDEQRAKAAAAQARRLQAKIEELTSEVSRVKSESKNIILDCCNLLQNLGKTTVKNFDIVCETQAVKPTIAEVQKRDELEQESSRDLSNSSINDLVQVNVLLRNLIYHTSKAIERIGRKLQELARAVPFWKKHRLAHEADLQARVATAEEKAANYMSITENALKQAKNAEELKNNTLKYRDSIIENAKTTVMVEIVEPLQDDNRKLQDENRKLKSQQNEWLNDFKNAATKLTGLTPKAVELFEQIGLDRDIGTKLWENAKKQHQQEQQEQHQNSMGYHF